MKENFDIFLIVMALLAAVVYAALHFFEAGYGYLFDRWRSSCCSRHTTCSAPSSSRC